MDIVLLIPVAAPFATAEFVHTLGTRAEACGFSALWVGEHVVVPAEWRSLYPASDDGQIPSAVQQGELDPFSTLGYLAGITRSIRLGACCNVAQRNPVYTAKEAANVDWLSGGRLEFGAGVGWAKEEFDACGIPFARRGQRARAHLEILRRLWSEPVAQYEGEFYSLPRSLLYPKPVQAAGLPVHGLGDAGPALERVAEFGAGFMPLNLEPDDLKARIQDLDQRLQQRGRTMDEITVSVIPPEGSCRADRLRQYQDAGADRVVAMEFVESYEQLEPVIENLAEQLVEPARSM